MKHRNMWLLMGVFLMALACPAFADTGGYDVGNIMDKYQIAAQQFGTAISSAALKVCFTLFTVDLLWTVLGKLIKGGDAVEIGVVVIFRIIWMGLVLWVMQNPSVPMAFVNGFIQLGKTGASVSAISPGDVFWQGVDLVNVMINSFADNATVAGVPVPAGIAAMANPFAAVLIGTALLVIIICYAMLAAQFAVAWIQLWFYMAVYPVLLAFGVTKWSKDLAMKVFTTPLVYGVRFLAIYFIIAVGHTLAADFGNEISQLSLTNLKPIWTVLAGSVLLFMLTLKVPTLASDLLSGSASMSAGDGAAGALAAGGAIGATAGALYAGGSTVANGVAGAIRAGQSAIGQAREKGSTRIVSTAARATGAVGSALAEAAGDRIKGLGSNSAGGRLAERIENRTASIRESNAATSVAAPSIPGGQPAVPSESTRSVAAPAAPADRYGSAAQPEATRPTPAAPSGDAAASTKPAAPASSVIDTSGDIAAAKAARDAGQSGMPAAPVSAPALAPAVPAQTLAPKPTAPATAASAAETKRSQPPAPSQDQQQPEPPKPETSMTMAAAQRAVSELEKTGGQPGGSVTVHHGEHE